MAPQYATEAEFEASPWADDVPPDGQLSRLLTRASINVQRMTLTAVYAADNAGMPTDQKVITAFRDATCAQVAYWANTGDVDGSLAASGSVSIGSVSLGATNRMSTSAHGRQDSRNAPESVSILMMAGLTTTGVYT